ncbi:PLP-dependent aminotransferase family protein [Staphylococcus carnosus]|uniref:GntR family transcriptional regulator n=1 Tax=Staphylococcus carnosus TaxID=1281 RepID=A0AAJ0JN83_STACA|nr:PLP-dependent aminotransferase family protein [Staphylococcus carnosus]KKB24322.1 GntR family transcriptional regulator [Staphylococcus carnosus]POA03390.1 PLP-dependent aminotransferase family protein [Staphylococcus carnosus]QQS86126.1 PLP-dependent aminotransferase family protein [Staphylococcus carnosus]QRQ06061.1 PLP-dependent aminotransferase family protein [Staphylococcus carnosus]UTB81943.1 GntR family transcriptional regulator [Staphylococcus carnosus]
MSQPLYMQLYQTLKEQIIEGQYKSGDRFPSKRRLAEHHSLSNTTIEHAYQYLLDEGYIYSKPRSGYYVSDIESLPIVTKETASSFPENKKNKDHQARFHFDLARIDTEHFPWQQFRKYSRDVFDKSLPDILQPGAQQGEYKLRQAIAHYLFNSRGVNCHPDQIIIGSSTEQLINQVTDILTERSYIIEYPSYPPIKQVLDKKGLNYKRVAVKKNGIDMQKVQKSRHQVVYVTPSHQFPTGYVMNLKTRTQLINWAQQHPERYIIEDDYDSEFRYFSKPIPALQSLDTTGKVIYISTFSKSLFPSCRIAFMVLPQNLMQRYHHLPDKEGTTVPAPMQCMVAEFMENGSFERHLNKMRKVYRYKLTYIIDALSSYKDQLLIEGATTGMHFTITVQNGLTLNEILERANSNHVKLTPLNKYMKKNSQNKDIPKFIIGFGGIKDEALKSHTDALIKTLTI